MYRLVETTLYSSFVYHKSKEKTDQNREFRNQDGIFENKEQLLFFLHKFLIWSLI